MSIPTDPGTIQDRNCANLDPEEFFPTKADVSGVNYAKRLCNGCPALDACLRWAMFHEQGTGHTSRFGVYGGLSGRQRADLAIQLGGGPKPITHGTEAGYRAHLRRDEDACQPCVKAGSEAKRKRDQRRRLAA